MSGENENDQQNNNKDDEIQKQHQEHIGDYVRMPPGYRFRATDEELMLRYLIPKNYDPTQLHYLTPLFIRDVELYDYNPWELPHADTDTETDPYEPRWFFTARIRRYRKGLRPNLGAVSGFWKPNAAQIDIFHNDIKIGTKRTLDFFIGKRNSGIKNEWKMYEYKIAEVKDNQKVEQKSSKDKTELEGWVLCKVYQKSPTKADRKGKQPAVKSHVGPSTSNIVAHGKKSMTTTHQSTSAINHNDFGGRNQKAKRKTQSPYFCNGESSSMGINRNSTSEFRDNPMIANQSTPLINNNNFGSWNDQTTLQSSNSMGMPCSHSTSELTRHNNNCIWNDNFGSWNDQTTLQSSNSMGMPCSHSTSELTRHNNNCIWNDQTPLQSSASFFTGESSSMGMPRSHSTSELTGHNNNGIWNDQMAMQSGGTFFTDESSSMGMPHTHSTSELTCHNNYGSWNDQMAMQSSGSFYIGESSSIGMPHSHSTSELTHHNDFAGWNNSEMIRRDRIFGESGYYGMNHQTIMGENGPLMLEQKINYQSGEVMGTSSNVLEHNNNSNVSHE